MVVSTLNDSDEFSRTSFAEVILVGEESRLTGDASRELETEQNGDDSLGVLEIGREDSLSGDGPRGVASGVFCGTFFGLSERSKRSDRSLSLVLSTVSYASVMEDS